MDQKFWKSKVFIIAVAALIAFCVKEFAGIDIQPTVDGLLNVLLPVLMFFGFANNPTNKAGFGANTE